MSAKIRAIASAIDEIEKDILDRSGIGNEYEQIDLETKREMRQKWRDIIEKHLEWLK